MKTLSVLLLGISASLAQNDPKAMTSVSRNLESTDPCGWAYTEIKNAKKRIRYQAAQKCQRQKNTILRNVGQRFRMYRQQKKQRIAALKRQRKQDAEAHKRHVTQLKLETQLQAEAHGRDVIELNRQSKQQAETYEREKTLAAEAYKRQIVELERQLAAGNGGSTPCPKDNTEDLEQKLSFCWGQNQKEKDKTAKALEDLNRCKVEGKPDCKDQEPKPSDDEKKDPSDSTEEDTDSENGTDDKEEDKSIIIGHKGVASTTRYWDCSGGACGCAFGKAANPVHCSANAMFKAPAGNPYKATFYGTAAISQALGGGMWLAPGCGKCWKVKGRANISGFSHETTLVLKAVNYCPPSNWQCANGRSHFDIAAPGFDWAGASLHNRCDSNQNEQALKHPQTCGTWMIDSQNPDHNCDCNRLVDPVLRAGCSNFKGLMWDNPDISYQEVKCPNELGRMPCWNKKTNMYPATPPKFCANPLA